MKQLPDISTQFSEWYQEVITQAELVDQAPVRGSMVIMPYGYAIWENIQKRLDKRIKETGHKNASFPLFIPESFLKKEAEHIEGFAPELAVVTHAGGKKLEEPLVVRPTSETIIHYMFARWIHSWRDLPLKINQWANVVRWEMRPRAFIRTTEFFWQEGHTAHATKDEAEQEANTMMDEYIDLAINYLATPSVRGYKTENEKFPGAEFTLTFEGLMPDGKALQMGTSHLLLQSFAKAFDMMFQDKEGKQAYPYLTSWGVTTRLIGALIMTHGDQKGLVLPPNIAPIHVIIIPIIRKNADDKVLTRAQELANELKDRGVRVYIDDDTHKSPGAKFYKWELKGVPLRIEIGPRDLENNSVVCVDRLDGNKQVFSLDTIVEHVDVELNRLQDEMYKRAENKMKSQWYQGEKLSDFAHNLETIGGFYEVGWCANSACEQELKKHKASIRCIIAHETSKLCFFCGNVGSKQVLIARSY